MATAEEIIRDKVESWIRSVLNISLNNTQMTNLLAYSETIMTALEDADWEPRHNTAFRIREKSTGRLGYERGRTQTGARDGTITTSVIIYWDDGSIQHVADYSLIERI